MAVANLCHKEWDEWKKDMGVNRGRKWTERMSCWANVQVNEAQDTEDENEGAKKENVRQEREVTEAEMVGVGRERSGREAEQWEEEGETQGETEIKVNEEVDEEEDRDAKEGEQVDEEDDGKDKQSEQGQTGQYDPRARFMENMNGSVQQKQESTEPEGRTMTEEDNVLDSVESDDVDSDWRGSEDESYDSGRVKDTERAMEKRRKYPNELEDLDEKSMSSEYSFLTAQTSKEREEEEDESEKLTSEAESWTTHEEEFQDYLEELQEEEEDPTDAEEAEQLMYEEVDCNDEDVEKIYCKDDYCTDIFRTLAEFRDSSLLTDLDVIAEGGRGFHVHSPVLAAVSSLIRKSLSRSDAENDESVGVNRWSVSLGPDVDQVGLEAVVEFAYSGLMSRLSQDTVEQIKAAAEALGAPRVLDLCTEEESAGTGQQKRDKQIPAAEQMMISLRSIKQLRVEGVGCDVTLEAAGESLDAHRVILAASSDYFRGMFTSGMKESHQPRVTLPFLLASELEALISCCYSGALPLSWRCVFEITSTALQLQYQPALSLCLNFLQQEMNPHFCLDVASFAEAYDLTQLLEVADDFVLRQFQKVVCTLKFRDLPAKQLFKYLNSRSLCVSSELVVFKAVVAWIQAKPRVRLRLAEELMKTIHFPLMTFKEFKEVQSMDMWSHHGLVELFEAIFEDFCSNQAAPQSQCRIYLPKESLVLTGGDQISEDLSSRSVSREVWFGNSLRNHTGMKKAMEWRSLGEMPETARFSHEVAVLEGQLYVFGGKNYYGISDTLNSVYRYDPGENSWESLADMQKRRSSFSVVVLDGKMYAIGGHCDSEHIDSVERYCPASNSWSFTWPLDLSVSGHVARVLQGQVFISGGLDSSHTCLASMFLYHPETGSTYLANMARPRAHHCMEILGGRLYVAGGITSGISEEDTATVDQLACEVYDPVADSWTAFISLPVPHVGAGSAVLEGKFYVLGGYSEEDFSDTKMVHRYDPSTRRWENMGTMPGPNNDIRAALLCLPPHFRS